MNNTAKLKLIDAQYAKIPTFKCVDGCTACCGPIVTSRLEYKRMLSAAGRTEKDVSQEALRNIKNGCCDCPFIDKAKQRCSIYEVRPAICRLFGAVDHETLKCPYGARPDVLLTDVESGQILKTISELGQ